MGTEARELADDPNAKAARAQRKIRDRCPFCHVAYTLPAHYIGQRAKCGNCDKVFYVGGLPPFLREELAERFAELTHLGAGGMGRVFRGIDRVLNQTRAIKVIAPPPGMSANALERARERFKVEIRTLATLLEEPHPNIVRFYFYGVRQGYFYYVMTYVHGAAYNRVLKREGAVPTSEAKRVGIGIASALEHMHARGLIHRDVKPGNIVRREEDGKPVLIDFGLAKDLETDKAELTAAHGGMGTMAYMPFEQKYNAKDVDHRADQYALAATLCHLLTGEVPDPPTLDRVNNEQLRDVLKRATQRDARRRFDSTALFREALEGVLVKPEDDLPTSATGVSGDEIEAWFQGRRPARPITPEFRARIEAEARRRAKKEVADKQRTELEAAGKPRRSPSAGELATLTSTSHDDSMRVNLEPARPKTARGAARAGAAVPPKDTRAIEDDLDVSVSEDEQPSDLDLELDLEGSASPDTNNGSYVDGVEPADDYIPAVAGEAAQDLTTPSVDPAAAAPPPVLVDEPAPAAPPARAPGRTGTRRRTPTAVGADSGMRPAVRTRPARGVPQARPVTAKARLDLTPPPLMRTLRGGRLLDKGHVGAVWAIDVSPDGRRIVTGSADRTWKLWDVATGKPIATHAEKYPISAVAFGRDGSVVAVGTAGSIVTVYSVPDRRKLVRLTDHSWAVNALRFFRGPSGERDDDGGEVIVPQLVSASGDGTVLLFDAGTFAQRAALHAGPAVQSIALTPDCQQLITGAEDGSMAIWEVGEHRLAGALQIRGLDREARALAVSPDGERAASACRDGLIRHWNLSTRFVTVMSRGHTQPVRGLTYLFDGALLASASGDGSVRFWDGRTGAERARIENAHKGRVTALARAPSDDWLATVGEDHLAKLWNVGKLREAVEAE